MENSTSEFTFVMDVDVEELSSFCKKENLLGSGGYGEVYRGKFEIEDVEQDVAIKRIPLDKAKNDPESERHIKLRNPNILCCYTTIHKNLNYG